MSKYVGARSHALQDTAEHRPRILAGNVARLSATGLALFLTFGFGGVAQAASGQAAENGQGAGVEGSAGTSTVGGPADEAAGKAEKPAEDLEGKKSADEDVVLGSSVDSERRVVTRTVTANGVTETTTEPVSADGGTSAADAADATFVARTANAGGPSANANVTANENAGGASVDANANEIPTLPAPASQPRVEHCHKNGKVIVISEHGARGHETGGHYDGGTDLLACAATVEIDPDPVTGGDSTPAPGTGGGTVSNPGTGGDSTPAPVTGGETVPNPAPGTGGETVPNPAPGTGGGTVPNPEIGGDSTPDPSTGGTAPDGDATPRDEDGLPEVAAPVPSQDDAEGPGSGKPDEGGSGGAAGGTTTDPEVRGEENERPRGNKPGTTTGVLEAPGGRLPVPATASADSPTRDDEVRGDGTERPVKNRPAALLLPDTGASSNLAAQAGAGLVMILGGALALRRRSPDSAG